MKSSKNNVLSSFWIFIQQVVKSNNQEKNIRLIKHIWSKLRIWIMLAIGVILFFLLIKQISFSDFLNSVTNVNPMLLLLAFITGMLVTILKSFRFNYFYPAGERKLELYGLFAILRVLYYVLPFNTGEIVYLTAFKKYRFTPSITDAAPTWFFLRLTDIIALSLWLIFILLFVHISGNLFGEMFSFRWIMIGITAILIVVILSFPFWVLKVNFNNRNGWFSKRLQQLQIGFKRTFGIKVLFRTLLISLLIWFSAILFDTLILLAFKTPLSYMECFLASIAIYCISLLPINAPLNLGTDEALWTGILVLAGVGSIQAISIALSIRVVNLLVLFTEGFLGFFLLFIKQKANYNLLYQTKL